MAEQAQVEAAQQGGLYHWVWRWHFYAGLFVSPFLAVLALTGALYLFENEIEGVVYRSIVWAKSEAALVSPPAQADLIAKTYPGAEIRRYVAPPDPGRAAEWDVRLPAGLTRTLLVDPSDGEILGAFDPAQRLMPLVSRIHGELLAGRVGDLLVELAASWTMVLLATGLFLWWPRRQRNYGVLTPKLSAKGRGFFRELHSVTAFWAAPLAAFLVFTGLPWSGFWGENLAKLGTLSAAFAPTPNFHAAPAAPHHHQEEDGKLPWAVRKAGTPHVHPADARAPFAAIYRTAEERGIDREGLRIMFPASADKPFVVSFVPDKAEDQRTLYVDPAHGAVLQDIGWSDYSPLGKTVEFGVMTHLGRQFGFANQLVMLAACLALLAVIGFGLLAWWKRRPPGKLAAPPAPPGFRPRLAALAVAVAIGVVFPLAGVTMLLIALAELVFSLRRARLRR